MIERFAIAALVIIGTSLVWILVQQVWRKIFQAYIQDEDALAARGDGCASCNCAGGVCQRVDTPQQETFNETTV